MIQTHSTCCETMRDRLRDGREDIRNEHGHAPREVAALNLSNENLSADAIRSAFIATESRIVTTCDVFDNFADILLEALAEVTRKPALGGRSRVPS